MTYTYNPFTDELDYYESGSTFTYDTFANIMGLSPTAGDMALASDELRFYVYDGTNWKESPIQFTNRTGQDMGLYKTSSLRGYGDDYITDKHLANCHLGGNATTDTGGIRVDLTADPDNFEIYLRSAWWTILYDLTTEEGDFRHVPLVEEIYVWRGDSTVLGLNSQPLVQEYETVMGVYGEYRVINGGTF
jgi:hypothetical protein